MAWTIKTKDNGKGNMYTAVVTHDKDYVASNKTSDGTNINLFYTYAKGAPAGTITWDLGIRNTDIPPDRGIVVSAVAILADGRSSVEATDRPKVRDGSGGGPSRPGGRRSG